MSVIIPAPVDDPCPPEQESVSCKGCSDHHHPRWLDLRGLCVDCRDRWAHREARAKDRTRECGVGNRHQHLASFAALEPGWDRAGGKAARDVAEFSISGQSVLGLIGKRGTGKTQLGAAAVMEAIKRDRSARIVDAMELMADLKGHFGEQGNTDQDWLGRWTPYYLLVIDEFGDLVAGPYLRAMLTLLVNKRYVALRPTIIVGNLERDQFTAAVGASIAERCNEGGGIIECDWQSFRR